MIQPADVFGVGAQGWTAISTSVGAGVALAAGIAAATIGRRQLAETRQVRKAEYQPYVVVYAEDSPSGKQSIDLVIKNTGRTAARDVRIEFSPAVDSVALSPEYSPLPVPTCIPVLVPNQEWRTFWDSGIKRTSEDQRSARYTATVQFLDSEGENELGPYEFVIDWTLIMNRGSATSSDDPVKSLQRIAKALEQSSRRS